MKGFKVAPVLYLLICTTASTTRWPTHIICKNDNLEVKYRSCDPLQDFALSIDHCSDISLEALNIRIAIILRHNIRELSVEINLSVNGQMVPIYNKQLCEQNHPKFQFCGKKKGEYFYYEGPISLQPEDIPHGDFNVSIQFFNEDRRTILCGDFFVRNS